MSSLKRTRTDQGILQLQDLISLNKTNIEYFLDDSTQEDDKRIAPDDYNFNFMPTLKPNQKLFDLDLPLNTSKPPVELSVGTLTHRFNARSRQFKCKPISKQSPVSSLEVKTYEPMYLRHQDISYTVIVYIQMAFNIIISFAALYIFTKMIFVVKQDFKLKAEEHTNALYQKKLDCTNHYVLNHCGQADRVPAIEEMCNTWASCMNREVVVTQAKVSAETIAEIINSFVEPISYKTLFFFSLLIIGTLLFSNLAFSLFKRNYRPPQAIAARN